MIEEISMMKEITNAIDWMVASEISRDEVILFLPRATYEALREELKTEEFGLTPPEWNLFCFACLEGEDAMIFDGIKCLPAAFGEGSLFVQKEFVNKKFF